MWCGNPNTRLLCRLITDFLLLIGVYCVALVVLPHTLHTAERGFHCNDASLSYPYRQPWITKVHLTLLVIALPAAIMLVVEMLRAVFVKSQADLKQRFTFVGVRIPSFISECYKMIGIYLFGLGLTLIVVKTTKHWVGRLRPFFFEICQPQWRENSTTICDVAMTTTTTLQLPIYIEDYACNDFAASTELMSIVRHSFPSGFAATTAYAMGFLISYAQVRLFASWLRLSRTVLQFVCFLLVLLVALERFTTFQNHWTDIAAGIVLGACLAVLVAVFVAHLFRRVHVKQRPLQRPRATNEAIYGYASYYNRPIYGY